jgi:hypothetical protein
LSWPLVPSTVRAVLGARRERPPILALRSVEFHDVIARGRARALGRGTARARCSVHRRRLEPQARSRTSCRRAEPSHPGGERPSSRGSTREPASSACSRLLAYARCDQPHPPGVRASRRGKGRRPGTGGRCDRRGRARLRFGSRGSGLGVPVVTDVPFAHASTNSARRRRSPRLFMWPWQKSCAS